jgi:hypothetical protein
MSHLADATAFDFAGLEARRAADVGRESGVEPWEEG